MSASGTSEANGGWGGNGADCCNRPDKDGGNGGLGGNAWSAVAGYGFPAAKMASAQARAAKVVMVVMAKPNKVWEHLVT